jgi:2-keto-4-pentenoate hydratase
MTREKANEALVNAMRKRGATAIGKATRLLVEARQKNSLAVPGDVVLQKESEAYQVQDAVYAELWPGTRPVAWKVGGPSEKVDPTAAPVVPGAVQRSPATVDGASMHMIGVEAEVAFRLSKDLRPRTRPYSGRSVAAAIGEVLVSIELCDTRLANWKKASGLWMLADFQNNSGLVAGSGTEDWQKIDFLQQEVEFKIGSRSVKAKGTHAFGNPMRLLPWLVAHCIKRGFGLHAGDIITTGAWTGLEIAKPGDQVTARFPGIGEATVQIT